MRTFTGVDDIARKNVCYDTFPSGNTLLINSFRGGGNKIKYYMVNVREHSENGWLYLS